MLIVALPAPMPLKAKDRHWSEKADAGAQAATITIHTDRPGAAVSPHQFGIFFEDINFGADGGLYAELIRNRSFEFPDPLMGWTQTGDGAGTLRVLERSGTTGGNRHFLRLSAESAASRFGLVNQGFRGIGVRQGEDYLFSVMAHNAGRAPLTLRLELINASGQPIGRAQVTGISGDWKKYNATIRATATAAKAALRINVPGRATVDLDLISLFPKKTWRGRAGGLRADLVQLLSDLKPGFVRFPGGCIVEGRELATRYQWKNTIGDVADRKLIINRWNQEFRHKPAPDYRNRQRKPRRCAG